MSYGNNAIYCSSPDQIPKIDHFAIITGTSVYTPGDQRSIDCPGHGYPASTDNYIEYKAFLEEDDWKEEINHLSTSKYGIKSFVAIFVKVPKISTKIEVIIE